MIKSPHAAKRHGDALVRIGCCAWLVVAAALAGCGNAADPTQVVAKVGADEITELQVNQALERQPGVKPDQLDAARRKLVSGLVQEEIVLQKARELKIDRDPRVVQMVEALKRDVLARAYLDRIAEGATKPSPKELQAYFDANPMLFKQRRLYTIQEFSVKVSDGQKAGIEAQLAALTSPAELEAYLKAQQIPSRSERTTAAAESLPLPVLQRIGALKPGQGLSVASNDGIRILLLLGTQDSPVTEEQARSSINVFLMNQRKRQVIESELAALRTSAKVEYFGKYADLAHPAVPPAAPASAGTAVAESTMPPLK